MHEFAVVYECLACVCVCVSNLSQEQSPEIIKPVPISHPPAPAPSASPTNAPTSSAYNKTARPFGGSSNFRAVSPSSAPAAPKASIPSASSAFTPAAPSQQPPPQGPQPPFPLASSSTSRTVSSLNPAPKPGSAYSPFSHSSSPSSSGSSSPARVTGPVPSSAPVVPQSSVYNTPINLYSNENACEVAMGQRRGLLEQQGGMEHQNG